MPSSDTPTQGATTGQRPAAVARTLVLCAGIVATAALQGCATSRNPDPLESWNRKVFAFNDAVDENVLKPVATGYRNVTPEPVRTAFTNFVNNIKDVWSTVNLFLQGRFADGTLGIVRFSVNSTLGLAGLIDIATPMQLERPNEDLGQTFGVWGAKPGAYIVWPILGPSTLRDSVGLPADMYFSASLAGDTPREKNLLSLWQGINLRANLLDASNLVSDVALDKYAFIRDAYLQRRQNLIYEGNPPDNGLGSDEDPYGYEDDDEEGEGTGDGAGESDAAPGAQSAPAAPNALPDAAATSGPADTAPAPAADVTEPAEAPAPASTLAAEPTPATEPAKPDTAPAPLTPAPAE